MPSDEADTSPRCNACGNIIEPMLGPYQMPDDAFVALKGQWMMLPQFSAPVFVIDPDTDPMIVNLPNGQTAILVDDTNTPHQHLHTQCMELLVHEEQHARHYADQFYDDFDNDDDFHGMWPGIERG